jgi:hypothetical protein
VRPPEARRRAHHAARLDRVGRCREQHLRPRSRRSAAPARRERWWTAIAAAAATLRQLSGADTFGICTTRWASRSTSSAMPRRSLPAIRTHLPRGGSNVHRRSAPRAFSSAMIVAPLVASSCAETVRAPAAATTAAG